MSAREKDEKQQPEFLENKNNIEEEMGDGAELLRVSVLSNEINIKGPTLLSCTQQDSSSVAQTALSAVTSKAAHLDNGDGRSLAFSSDEITVVDTPRENAVGYPEARGGALSTSNSTSGGQNERNTAQLLEKLRSLMVRTAHGQLSVEASMIELVEICDDANTAAMVHNLFFQSAFSLAQLLTNLALHSMYLYERSAERCYIEKSLKFIRASKDALGSANNGGLIDDPAAIYNLEGRIYHTRFEHFGDLDDIENAIGSFDKAIEFVDDDNRNMKAILQNSRGSCLIGRFERLGGLDDLDQAVKAQKQAVGLMPDEDADKPSLLNNLGNSLRRRFERLEVLGDLDQAVKAHQQAIDLMPDGHDDKILVLNDLVLALLMRFESSGDLSDLNRAVKAQYQVIYLTPDGHASKSSWLNNLGSSLRARFERLGDLDDLDHAVKTQQQAVDLTPDGHADKPLLLKNLGTSLRTRFVRLGDLTNLNQMVQAQQQAVDLTPDGHPDKPSRVNNLGIFLLTRFEWLGDLDDLYQSVKTQERAVDLTPDEHADKSMWLNNLGNSLGTRFKESGNLADLDQAVKRQQQAVDLTPDGHPDKPLWLNNLGTSLTTWFEQLGDLADLDKAVAIKWQAVDLTPDSHASKPALLRNLGNSLRTRFKHLGDLDDLNQAAKKQQQALDLTPDGHTEKPSILDSLGSSLGTRFERLGNLSDIDQAIRLQQQAVDLAPDGHIEKPIWLHNLGISFGERFEWLGDLSDLGRAVERHQQAVDIIPDGHTSRPLLLDSLGGSLLERFRRLGDRRDLSRAVRTYQQAVDSTPDKHTSRPLRLNNLANSLLKQFEQEGDLPNLNQAVQIHQRAIDLTPHGHPNTASLLGNLGNSLDTRFVRLGDMDDLDQSLKARQQAVDLTPDGHASKPVRLIKLSMAVCRQIQLLQVPTLQDHTLLISSLHTAATYPAGPPSIRFNAAGRLANHLHPQLQPYQIAINLIPQVVWVGRTISQRYNDLQPLGELVMDAVSAACAASEYGLALEWIEQGRAIIWGQILQLRSPLDTLQTAFPDLANELNHTARALEMAGTSSFSPTETAFSAEDAAQEHRRLAKEWEDTLALVRTLPNFSDFLKPKLASVLRHALADKTVVLVNVSCYHSDALILQPNSGSSSIFRVPLPTLSANKVNEARDKLITALRLSGVRFRDSERGSTQKRATPRSVLGEVHSILQMLWRDVAKPILDHLGHITPQSSGDLPHITWCLTGALAMLPLHAAGIYTSTSTSDKIFNYAVSSYTPSLTFLIHGLERTPTTPSARSLLAVTQENTPNLAPLPAAMGEAAQIKALMEKYNIDVTRMDGGQATVKSVSDAMNDHSWIHIACHGTQHTTEPTKCAFSLHDGPLELIEIMKKPLKRAELAYLSACQTASGHATLPNEAIHLAAGMFTAGYRTVIATLWSIMDRDAPTVAQEFYDRLLSNPGGGAAKALHEAVGVLRERVGEENILAWVPYIHIGC